MVSDRVKETLKECADELGEDFAHYSREILAQQCHVVELHPDGFVRHANNGALVFVDDSYASLLKGNETYHADLLPFDMGGYSYFAAKLVPLDASLVEDGGWKTKTRRPQLRTPKAPAALRRLQP